MSTLIIVESPAKAKTIEKYLKNLGDFKVVASVGHVRDIPKSNKEAINIEKGFVPKYIISPGKEKVISDIHKLANKADEVLLATDPDREGEAIAWHIAEAVHLKNPKRIVFNEITEEAVKLAVLNPREIDMNLKQAQEARRVLDRLFGYDLSGLIWKKVRYGLSAGRVQSPALRIIMEREREIRAFIPETFWVITADVKPSLNKSAKNEEAFTVKCVKEPRDKKEVERILEIAKAENWKIKDVKETKAKRSPKAPFITSTLQQTASTRLGLSPSRTMQIAQRLYEAGHISYMRTDSTNLSENVINQIKSLITKEFGADHYAPQTYGKKSKNAQEAHEAVRPSKISVKHAGANAEQKALYDLIWSRTVASQMIDAEMLRTKIIVEVNEKDSSKDETSIPHFTVSGQRLVKEGWLKADLKARGEETEVPKVSVGDILDLIKIHDEEKETQPPSRYTEAGLIKELEKRGIGRPSTYAPTIRTLNDRGYVEKEGKTLIPTDTGDVVSSFVEENFTDYISDSFTAEMEDELDEIANGRQAYIKTLSDFYGPFSKDIESKETIAKITNLGDADNKHICPKCKSKMVIKLGRGGKFLSCSTYPDCDGALTIDGKEVKANQPLGKHPETGEDIFVLNGRFGPYVQIGQTPEKKKAKTKKIKKVKKTDKDKTKKEDEVSSPTTATEDEVKKPRRASIPKEIDFEKITLDQAVKLLVLPRILGENPETGKEVMANIGRFGPYVGHDGEFRSIKPADGNPYDISLKEALTLLAKPKQPPRGAEIVKIVGKHPKTNKEIILYKSKSGHFLKKGLQRIYLPDDTKIETMDLDKVLEILK